MHFSVLYLSFFLLFPMSLTPCSLLKAAYPHVPRNLLAGLRKVRRLMSRTYIGGYSAGAGSNLARFIFERSHVLLVGKNCSRNSNCQADSFLAHLRRRLIGELIVQAGIRRPSVRPSTFSNDFSSEAVKPILSISHIASIGVCVCVWGGSSTNHMNFVKITDFDWLPCQPKG